MVEKLTASICTPAACAEAKTRAASGQWPALPAASSSGLNVQAETPPAQPHHPAAAPSASTASASAHCRAPNALSVRSEQKLDHCLTL